MRIILTGSSGYIGSQVAHRLIDLGNEIYAIIRPGSKLDLLKDIKHQIHFIYDEGSVENMTESFTEIKADAVIHIASLFLAEHTMQDVDRLLQSNIIFSTHLLEAMVHSGTKNIISTSTSWEHYNSEQYNPVCLYSATKKAFEDILKYYVEAKDLNAIILSIFDTYGAGDPRKKIINLFERISQTGESLDMSPGEQYLDLIYIEDIIDAYICALDRITAIHSKGIEKYYLRSGNAMRLKDIAELYSKVNDVTLKINWGKREYRTREVMDTYKDGTVLPGWSPKVSLAEGLAKLRDSKGINKSAPL
jgi:nucleoside-diphosphate-sugar epimerase